MRQMVMRHLGLGLFLGAMLSGLGSVSAWAANSVEVQSKSVVAGTTGVTIGISVSNDMALNQYVIPLEIRSVSDRAFITSLKRSYPAGTRLDGKLIDFIIANQYETPDGLNCKTPTPDTGTTLGYLTILNQDQDVAYPVTASPEGMLFVRGKIFGPGLPIGADGATHQIAITVDIGYHNGTFEIDTACCEPANHLIFTTPAKLMPSFTKGTITVTCPDTLPVPSGPVPADNAQDQPDSVILKWNHVCAVPITYDVFFGSDCDSLALKCDNISVDTCLVTGLDPNRSYFWKVVADGNGQQTTSPCWSFKVGTGSAVQYLGGDGIPRDYDLDQNYPNPFNASTVIKFNTKHDGHVRLDVYNILGQKVRTLVDEFRNFGPQAADWDGTDVVGKAVPTGLYFYRLVTSDFTDVKKMVLLK